MSNTAHKLLTCTLETLGDTLSKAIKFSDDTIGSIFTKAFIMVTINQKDELKLASLYPGAFSKENTELYYSRGILGCLYGVTVVDGCVEQGSCTITTDVGEE